MATADDEDGKLSLRYFGTDDYQRFQPGTTLVRAAFKLLKESTGNVTRQSKQASFPAYSHQVMVRDILNMAEQSDYRKQRYGQVMKAAALLHDVIEDDEELKAIHHQCKNDQDYKQHPKETEARYLDKAGYKLREWLDEAFDESLKIQAHNKSERGEEEEDGLARVEISWDEKRQNIDEVVSLCKELTNPINLPKRFGQVDKAQHLSHDAGLIKIVDQIASVVDHIMQPEEPGNKTKLLAWRNKARDVVTAIARRHPDLEMWANIYREVDDYDRNIILAGEGSRQAKKYREQFRFNEMIDKAAQKERGVTLQEITEETAGCYSLQLNDKGKVTNFSLLVRPDLSSEDERDEKASKDKRNETAITFVNNLETQVTGERVEPTKHYVVTGDLHRSAGNHIWQMRISPPMDWQQFQQIADDTKAIPQTLKLQANRMLAQRAQDSGRSPGNPPGR